MMNDNVNSCQRINTQTCTHTDNSLMCWWEESKRLYLRVFLDFQCRAFCYFTSLVVLLSSIHKGAPQSRENNAPYCPYILCNFYSCQSCAVDEAEEFSCFSPEQFFSHFWMPTFKNVYKTVPAALSYFLSRADSVSANSNRLHSNFNTLNCFLF